MTASTASPQLQLPIAFAPEIVRDHGLREAHSRPLVSYGKAESGPFRSWRVPAHEAWAYPEIELRTPNSWPVIVLDLDGSDAEARLEYARFLGQVPLPSWSVKRRSSGGIHVAYALARPVLRGPLARRKPLLAVARVSEYMSQVLHADAGFVGVLTHNPEAPAIYGFETSWGRHEPFTLGELAAIVPDGWRMPPKPSTEIGRNCGLFDALMRWAGSPHNRGLAVLPVAEALNAEFDAPLGLSEVQGIARSVERYRARWEAQGMFWEPEELSERGRRSGRRSGEARRAKNRDRDRGIIKAREAGLTYRVIAVEFGVSAGTAHRVFNELHS